MTNPDIPEPPPGSIVLDHADYAWQRRANSPDWYRTRGTHAWVWTELTNLRGPLTVVYTPPSASQPEPPVGAVVRDAKGGDVWQRYADRGWFCVTGGSLVRSGIPWEELNKDFGPVDVLSPQPPGAGT